MSIPLKKVVAVVGPTSSGKSDLAVLLAKKFNGEVVSADSRQVYRKLDIGTGKIPGKWRIANGESPKMRVFIYKGVRHHLIDFTSPKRRYTAENFQKDARKAIEGILERGRLPIVAGGTGFYIDSLMYDYAFPKVKPRDALRRKLAQESDGALFEKLRACDPKRAAAIDPKNKVRLIRALEITLTTGHPIPRLTAKSRYNILKIGIAVPSNILKKKIHERLIKRLRQGMIREVCFLHARGISWKRLYEFGLEYRAVADYLQKKITKKELIERLEKEIWHYAKRQMTWFKRDHKIHWTTTQREPSMLTKKFLKNPA